MGASAATAFQNVTYENVIGSLLRLLDSGKLPPEKQIAGLSILRKIVEGENKQKSTPSADWCNDDWKKYEPMIKKKQDIMIERGTIQFLCKHIGEVENPDI